MLGSVAAGRRELVLRALLPPEPEDATDRSEHGRDRALVRPLRPFHRAGDGLAGLLPQHALGDDPRQPARDGVPPVEDAHAGTLALLLKKRAAPLRQGAALGERRGRRAARPLCGDEGTSLAIKMPPSKKPCATFEESFPSACS